jgi:hypothetical protein
VIFWILQKAASQEAAFFASGARFLAAIPAEISKRNN